MKGMRGLKEKFAPALTVDRRNKDLILLAVGTGMLTLAGMAAYWLPLAAHLDDLAAAQAAKEDCHHGWCGLAVAVYITWVYLLWSTVLVLLGSVIIGLIRKRKSQREEKASP